MGTPNKARISERGWRRPEPWVQTLGAAPQPAAERGGPPHVQSKRVLHRPEPRPASFPRPNKSPPAAVGRADAHPHRHAHRKVVSHTAVKVKHAPRDAEQLVPPVDAAGERVNNGGCGDDCPGGNRFGECAAGPASVLATLGAPGAPAPVGLGAESVPAASGAADSFCKD